MSKIIFLFFFWTLRSTVSAVTNPISVQSAILLGNQTSENYAGTYRDGGWEGVIGSTYFQVYGDTLNCSSLNAIADCDALTFRANTVAVSTLDALLVRDFEGAGGIPPQFCDSPSDDYRLHVTNIISTSSTTGLVWYANVSMPNDVNIDGTTIGGGVATVTYNGQDFPECSPLPQIWGPDEPNFGIFGAEGNNLDGYIYLFGSLGANIPGVNDSDVFVSRVFPGSATIPTAYEYWNGSDYSPTRLIYPVFNGYAPSAVLQDVTQGSVFFSNYYAKYIYLYPVTTQLVSQIMAVTSQFPAGPWSSPVLIYTGSFLYDPVAQPRFDPSGKTLIFDVSNFGGAYLSTVKVTFN